MTDEFTTSTDRIPITPVNGTPYQGGCWYFVRGSKVHVHLSISGIPKEISSIRLIDLPEGKYPKVNEFCAISHGTLESVGMVHLSTNGYVSGTTSDGYAIGDFEYYWR